jgi:ABC-type oligopeptide transport system substrate-binding subunit
LVLLCLAGLPGLDQLAGQKPPEAPAKPPAKPRVEDEEGPGKVPVQLEDRILLGPASLLKEAANARHPAVRALYQRLAVPHDEVVLAGAKPERPDWCEPIGPYLGPEPRQPLAEGLVVRTLDAAGRRQGEMSFAAGQRVAVWHYERLAIDQVDEFFKAVEKIGPPLPRLEMLRHAERVLAEAVRFHETARDRRQRYGPEWDKQDADLRKRLREVRLDQLRTLADARNDPAVADLARQLAAAYPQHPDVRAEIIRIYLHLARLSFDPGKLESCMAVRRRLEQLDEMKMQVGSHDLAVRDLRIELEKSARARLAGLEKLSLKDKPLATKLIREAESIWPALPELPRLRRDWQLDSVMYVGVGQLPEFLSPATAASEAERQALEVLFESLVRPVADASGQSYEMLLADGRPRLLPLGRQFQIVRNAFWYREGRGPNDPGIEEEVTADDVTAMLHRFQKPLRSPEWTELLADSRSDASHSLRLTFHQGCWDPLSLMTFKVLPAKYLKDLDDPDFARQPIGSGPYFYAGREKHGTPPVEYAVFRANPTYGRRAGKNGQPFIREVRFFRPPDLRTGFGQSPPLMHLLLDPPTRRLAELMSRQAQLPHVKVHTLRSRRIWILAVNHRQPQLQNPDLRLAIALAIHREKILDDFFRDPDLKISKPHRALNGPYPPGSWACDPRVPEVLFDPARAKARANVAKAAGVKLELKYSAGQDQAKEACERIKSDVQQHAGIELVLKSCTPAELRRAVEIEHSYQLAYYHWDFADESYWLWPLFDPKSAGPGGRNFLGPTTDGSLENLFHQVTAHREFSKIQWLTQQIHRHIHDTMPLIPLWQLDTHIAIHDSLRPAQPAEQLDALQLFAHLARWKLEK